MIERVIGQQFFVSDEELCSLTNTNINNIKYFCKLEDVFKISTLNLNNSNIYIDEDIDIIFEEDDVGNKRIWLRRYSLISNEILELLSKNKPLNYSIIEDYIKEIYF
jgi:hypothetical protein